MNIDEKQKQQRIADLRKANRESKSFFSKPTVAYLLLAVFLLASAIALPPLF